MLTTAQIREHYSRPEVKAAILRCSSFPEGSRAAMICDVGCFTNEDGSKEDYTIWYTNSKGSKYPSNMLDLSNGKQYRKTVYSGRTLYWTLNIFNKGLYAIDYTRVTDSAAISRRYTVGYTFGVDIDKEHGCNITDPAVKQAVELMAQYFSDTFRKYCPDSVYCLFSGGGIYVMIDHRTFQPYFERFQCKPEWDKMLKTLLNAFDDLICSIRDEFFELHPECKGKVKPDALNNSRRVFKTLFSIHKTLDYAVVPLDPCNIKIDFTRATLPLREDVIEEGDKMFSSYTSGEAFLDRCLKPFLEKAYSKLQHTFDPAAIAVAGNASAPIESSKWPPCIRNLCALPVCKEGQTRALALIVSFLHQTGYSQEEAYKIFSELVDRWGARSSNIFESYWEKNMNTPSCDRLTSNDNTGFPKGCSIKRLNVCKPDAKCLSVPSPRYYADAGANKQRLLNRLGGIKN